MSKSTEVLLEDDDVCVMFRNGSYYTKKFESIEEKNMWLWVLGTIYENTKINIHDKRKHLQSHQFNISCQRGELEP